MSETPTRWWQSSKAIIGLLFFFPPVGMVLVWTSSNWTSSRKKVATVLGSLWLLIVALNGSTTQPQQPQQAQAVPQVSGAVGKSLADAKRAAMLAGHMAVSHDASEGNASQFDDNNWVVCFQSNSDYSVDFGVVRNNTPCPARDGGPIPWPSVPALFGWKFVDAEAKLLDLGASSVTPRAGYLDKQPPANPDDWIVCFQDPAAGSQAKSPFYPSLSVVEPGDLCPLQQGTYLNPPDTDPDPDPDVRRSPAQSGNSSGNSSDDESGGAAYYPNCSTARAAGVAPIYAGEPGYRGALDRNKDGVACED